ncbi:MAG: hypothetical protein HQL32_00815 [Planctomycetes bacterium]|nr:hypothetical protein [Planctomycetota bacterium]
MSECKCGTLYYIDKPAIKPFRCNKCKRAIFPALAGKNKEANDRKLSREEKQALLPKWLFMLGSSVGLFCFLMTIPSIILFKNSIPLLTFLLCLEVIFGTLLITASFSFYLLSIQVRSMQSLINFQQHNLRIFADQISKLYMMLKRND